MKSYTNKDTRPQREPFRPKGNRKYIAFFKPYGVICQFGQPRPTEGAKPEAKEKETLANFDFPPRVYPLGRLDTDSEGLLLLSDDGDLNDILLHPRNAHTRTYFSQVERVPEEEALRKLEIDSYKQVQARLLPGEPDLPPRPPHAPIRFRKNIPTAWVSITMTEGKNRQVRKMTAAVGYPTLRLVRVAIGKLQLRNLKLAPGEWKYLGPNELNLVLNQV
ncbi:MAG: pseudouridine synthase [Candidatus Melainabacteria bacterium]|nr:pseudouridine synthase [Candidatus Melainabacteria bacterium]